ncbi:hypothetical protein C9417_29565 [Rhizobium sp. SEMIA 4088]|nr:hypothetical protein C9417_29565 [Rhizobium sp. SEMIA 4088]
MWKENFRFWDEGNDASRTEQGGFVYDPERLRAGPTFAVLKIGLPALIVRAWRLIISWSCKGEALEHD